MSVYFAQVGRYIKVGFSENPERRVARLFTSTTRYNRPWDMPLDAERVLLATIPGDKSTERMCHRALSDYAAGCEFFIDEPGVREFMTRAAAGDFSPVERPGGEFVPVHHSQMLPERRAELDSLITRSRRKAHAASP
jgi:hypothetical protein